MEKDKWAHAEEIEANRKNQSEPDEMHAEEFTLPVLSVDIGETDEDDHPQELESRVSQFLEENPELHHKIETENLDIVAHKIKKPNGKTNWALIIGFGFATIGIGLASYKLIHKYNQSKKTQK